MWPRETRSLSCTPPPFLGSPSSLSPVAKQVLVVLAAWMTGCGRAGRVKQGPHPPSPPSFPFPPSPSPLSPVARRTGRGRVGGTRSLSGPPPFPLPPLTRCEAGDWSCWPRETRSLSCPPFPHLPPPLLSPVMGRMWAQVTEHVGASDRKRMGASDRECVGASDGATDVRP